MNWVMFGGIFAFFTWCAVVAFLVLRFTSRRVFFGPDPHSTQEQKDEYWRSWEQRTAMLTKIMVCGLLVAGLVSASLAGLTAH